MSRPIKDFILESLEKAATDYQKHASFLTKLKDSQREKYQNNYNLLYLESSLHDRLREEEGITSSVITEPKTFRWLPHSILSRENAGSQNIEYMDLTIIIHGSYKRRYKLTKG